MKTLGTADSEGEATRKFREFRVFRVPKYTAMQASTSEARAKIRVYPCPSVGEHLKHMDIPRFFCYFPRIITDSHR